MRLLKRVLRDEKGASMIIVAIAVVVIFGFAVLTIDLSLMQLAKTQLQNAADAAVLAGARALGMKAPDRPAGRTAATKEAIRIAALNVAIQDNQRPVEIGEVDVTFSDQHENLIMVRTHRTKATKDSVTLYFLKVLDPLLENIGEMTATASAKFFPVCGTDCLRPFCPPDRWTDSDGDSTWDPGEPYGSLTTGYRAPDDIGTQVILRLRQPSEQPRMNYYYAVRFAPINTGDPVEERVTAYRNWIIGCEPYMVTIGDQLQIEPDPTVGPTTWRWLEELIGQDPDAYWDPATGTVKGSIYPASPRIIKVCAFDPRLGVRTDGYGRDYVTVSKIMALFIEGHNDTEIVGRFMKMVTQGTTGDSPGGFLFKVALVPNS
jgi:Flp pilus assembly pilin Flp